MARSLSRFHTPHRLTAFATYQIPGFENDSGLLGHALGGWKVAAVLKLAVGTPFTVVDSGGVDLNFDGFAETRPALLDQSLIGKTVNDPETSQQILRRDAFRPSGFSDFGCCVLGRNTFLLDGANNFDIGIYKYFKMPFENHRLVFRADLFNALNHVQYGFPINDTALRPSDASAGRPRSMAHAMCSFRYVTFSNVSRLRNQGGRAFVI